MRLWSEMSVYQCNYLAFDLQMEEEVLISMSRMYRGWAEGGVHSQQLPACKILFGVSSAEKCTVET